MNMYVYESKHYPCEGIIKIYKEYRLWHTYNSFILYKDFWYNDFVSSDPWKPFPLGQLKEETFYT